MNALELAEDLEGAKLVILRLNDMLRQQRSEIEELKSNGYKLVLLLNDSGIKLQEAKSKIEELKADVRYWKSDVRGWVKEA